MKKTITALCASGIILFSCNEKKATDEEVVTKDTASQQTAVQAPPMDSAAAAKAWQDYMTPGEFHEMLAKDNGMWTEEMTMWWEPGKPPQKHQAQAVNTMILNGLYQQGKHTGNFNGMPFEGISVTGYNKARKIFESTWIDNMGSGIMYMEGPWDEATKTIHLKGKSTDPTTGQEYQIRETFKVVDDNNQQMEMFETRPGMEERKTMEIKFTRKTKA